MFKKVLLAMDSSSAALELFNCIPDLKKMGLEELFIIHVVDVEILRGETADSYRGVFKQRIDGKMKAIEEDGIRVQLLTPMGHPSEEIARAAEKEDVDLILIGAVGESIIREIFLGSTVNELIRLSNKPILVEKYITLGEKTRRIPVFLQKWATVLMPSDFSEASMGIFQQFLNNADKLHRIILLHVVDKGHTESDIERHRQKAKEKLEVWKKRFEEKGVTADIHVATGIPSQQINEVAEFEGATLIAMPTRGLGYLANLVIGSTADAVVRRSSRPVLLYRARESK